MVVGQDLLGSDIDEKRGGKIVKSCWDYKNEAKRMAQEGKSGFGAWR